MSDKSSIEWTEATWNPVTGCTKLSPGCDHCYAERFAERWRGIPGHAYEFGFDLRLQEKRLSQPSKWRQGRFIFVNSMSDLFQKEIPAAFIDKVFDEMERCSHHIFQVLTKRSSLLRKYVNRRYSDRPCPPHIWLGVSVEDAQRKSRITHLRDANAEIRFLSLEPLLGPLGKLDLTGIHWIIVGGESGPGFRAVDANWVREIRDQALASGVPFFFKQWGGLRPKTGGRTLDDRLWDEMPIIDHPLFGNGSRMAAE